MEPRATGPCAFRGGERRWALVGLIAAGKNPDALKGGNAFTVQPNATTLNGLGVVCGRENLAFKLGLQ